MYNGYGERRLKFARIPLSELHGAMPAGTEIVDLTLHAESGNTLPHEVLVILSDASWPVVVAGGDIPELVAPEAEPATAAAPEASPTELAEASQS